jgi:hypothetical protein
MGFVLIWPLFRPTGILNLSAFIFFFTAYCLLPTAYY